jgi:TrmH family RNA methyltransferase
MERISSRHNPIVKRFRDVARGAAGDGMLLDGEHLIQEALASGIDLSLLAIAERFADSSVASNAVKAGTRIVIVDDEVLAAVSPVRTPSGMVAIAPRPACSLEQVLATGPPLVVVLHDVQDPGNVGAIARASEACGATGLVCTEGTADPFGWKALRGAMGSTLRLPTAAKQSIVGALAAARAHRLTIFALTARSGVALPECDFRQPAAILLGGEGAGLPAELVDAADACITIPMRAPVESLNVAVAAALVVYEADRQRSASLIR